MSFFDQYIAPGLWKIIDEPDITDVEYEDISDQVTENDNRTILELEPIKSRTNLC